MHRLSTDPHPFRTDIPYSKVLHHIPVVGPVRLYITGRGICSMSHQFCLFRLDAIHQIAAFELLFGLHEITIHYPSAPTFLTLRFCITFMWWDRSALYLTRLGICSNVKFSTIDPILYALHPG